MKEPVEESTAFYLMLIVPMAYVCEKNVPNVYLSTNPLGNLPKVNINIGVYQFF